MGRDYIVTKSSSVELGKKKRTFSRSIVIGPNAIKFVTLTIIAILAVVYLSQSTAGAGRSVQIRELQSKKDDLSLEKERLEAEQTRLKALKEIDSGVPKQIMEPVSSVGHVDNGSKTVARAN